MVDYIERPKPNIDPASVKLAVEWQQNGKDYRISYILPYPVTPAESSAALSYLLFGLERGASEGPEFDEYLRKLQV